MSDRISSAYNFVPVPEKVVYPDWADFVSHDRPFQDGVCGELEIEIKNESPLFIRGKSLIEGNQETVYQFFRDGQGQVAIPGTSIRGMLRSVLEIASFAKLDPVNDVRFGLRDLKIPHLYGNHMASVQRRADNAKSEPMPLVNAGWLKMKENDHGEVEYWIDVCHFAKIEYQFLMNYASKQGISFLPGNKQSSVDKYKTLSKHEDVTKKQVSFHVKTLLTKGTPTLKGGKRLSEYSEVKPLGELKSGYLVLTGQPQNYHRDKTGVKHHDFFFYGSPLERISVSADHFRDFEMIHADGAEQHKDEIKGNEEWSFWKKRMKKGQSVPVFFIMQVDEKGQQSLKSFGLAMMFRLAYDLSVGEVVTMTQPSKSVKQQDLAQLMFGYVEKEKLEVQHGLDRNALRGRVSIEQAVLQTPQAKFLNILRAVFGGPKASFYPAYLQQGKQLGDSPEKNRTVSWRSYMQESSPRLRGWKRYLIRHQPELNPPLPEKASDKVITRIRPLDKGHTFSFKIHFHNLREIELGALLWVIDFGATSNCYHSLGMGKNLGLGKVQLKLKRSQVVPNDFTRAVLDMKSYVSIFQEYMAGQTNQQWASSNTIRELIACAMPNPNGVDPSHLAQPQLKRVDENGKSSNDFVKYKTNGSALPLHGKAKEYQLIFPEIQKQLIAKSPSKPQATYTFDWKQFEIDVKGEEQVRIGAGIQTRPELKVEQVLPLPNLLMVQFVDFLKVREFRQNYDERKKKNKEIKHQIFILKPSMADHDPRLQKIMLNTERFEYLEILLQKIKNSNASIHFTVSILPDVGADGYAVAGGMIV